MLCSQFKQGTRHSGRLFAFRSQKLYTQSYVTQSYVTQNYVTQSYVDVSTLKFYFQSMAGIDFVLKHLCVIAQCLPHHSSKRFGTLRIAEAKPVDQSG